MRAGDVRAKIAAVTRPAQDSIAVLVSSAQRPITGQVQTPGQPERPFVGWLELLAALDGAIGALQAVEPPSAAPRMQPRQRPIRQGPDR